MVLYSADSSLSDRSKRFTLYILTYLFIPTPTRLLWKAVSVLQILCEHNSLKCLHRLTLELTKSIALAKHLRGFLNILITHSDCFPKCCEVVTTLLEQLSQVNALRFVTHIVIMTSFSQLQFKPWQRFVPQRFICQVVSSRSMVHVVWFDTQRDIGGVGCIHTCVSS